MTMIRFLNHAVARKSSTPPSFGHLEGAVMEVLWAEGESNVHGVIERLRYPRAYTTVMTTLDRLFKKGFLNRRKADRAFFYAPRLSRPEWERKRADELVADFLSGSQPSGELLISSLVEAVGQHDETLLDELEKKIKAKRKELDQRGKS